jgi:hypothetical protein
MQAMMGQAVSKLKETQMMLVKLAQQFPGTVPSLREAQGLIGRAATLMDSALQQTITRPGVPEPPAPAIGG